jgi:hypothetical protein
VISNELQKTKDFARIREEAKRKGKILRTAIIDDKEMKSEAEFEV